MASVSGSLARSAAHRAPPRTRIDPSAPENTPVAASGSVAPGVKSDTAAALHRINRDFYRHRAREFAATRRRPWPGWRRALEVFRGRAVSGRTGALRILDVGCGNGRLAAFLADRGGRDWRYLGLDASPELLVAARRRLGGHRRFLFAAADVVERGWPMAAHAWEAQWVAGFGLFHHVAGLENRRRLIRRLARRLAPGGLLTLSFWQFADRSRFARRLIDWREGLRLHAPALDLADLEPGDHLLAWGDGSAVRYCHHIGDAEAAELVAASGLETLASFRADGESGDLNLYVLLAR